MRKTVLTLLAMAALVASASSVSAQTTNFAGKWTLQVDPAAAPPAGGGGGGGGRMGGGGGMGGGFCGPECTITQDATTLTVSRMQQGAEVKTIYKLDGSDSKNTRSMNMGGNAMELVSTSVAKWDAGKLVITTKTDMMGNMVESKAVLALAGTELTLENTNAGRQGGAPTTTTQKYKKG